MSLFRPLLAPCLAVPLRVTPSKRTLPSFARPSYPRRSTRIHTSLATSKHPHSTFSPLPPRPLPLPLAPAQQATEQREPTQPFSSIIFLASLTSHDSSIALFSSKALLLHPQQSEFPFSRDISMSSASVPPSHRRSLHTVHVAERSGFFGVRPNRIVTIFITPEEPRACSPIPLISSAAARARSKEESA